MVKIINQEKKRKELQKNDINRGYAEIFYNTVKFERKKLCHGEFSMMLPVFFDMMKKPTVVLKYGVEYCPDFVYTNEEMDINITFSFLDGKQIGTDILKVQQELEQDIKEMDSNITIEKEIFNTKQELPIIQFVFPLQIQNDTILEVIFLFLINCNWVVGTFHCPFTQKRDWINIVKQMLLSIQLENQEEDYE